MADRWALPGRLLAIGGSRLGEPARSGLVYWSSTEHRFKPVPTNGAIMRAARSAASEVNTYLGGKAQRHPDSDSESLIFTPAGHRRGD